MHSIDKQMHVWMFAVAMCDNQHLMILQAESGNYSIGNALHRNAIDSAPRAARHSDHRCAMIVSPDWG
jgi:hypothetical protein